MWKYACNHQFKLRTRTKQSCNNYNTNRLAKIKEEKQQLYDIVYEPTGIGVFFQITSRMIKCGSYSILT